MRCPTLKELPSPLPGKKGWPWTEESPQLPNTMPDGRPWPKVSIVTPSYNQGQFLEETIRSVLLQGYPNLEYIVIDGGSDDNSVEIIEKYDPWLTYWVSEPDRGQAHAINKGFEKAHGKILGWLNSDDLFLQRALAHIAKVYVEKKEAVAWVGGCLRVDEKGTFINEIIPRGVVRDNLGDWGRTCHFYQPACFFSSEIFYKAGKLNEDLRYAFDLDLWIRLAEFGEFFLTQFTLAAAHIHPLAKTQSKRIKMHSETIRVQIEHRYHKCAFLRLERLIWRAATRRAKKIVRELL